jgi:cellobiose phosphorylase
MVNDRFMSVTANDGSSYKALKAGCLRVTKYHSSTDYLLRTLNGKRTIKLIEQESQQEYDLLQDCEEFKFTVKPGISLYEGKIANVLFSIELFVPNSEPCECCTIRLKGKGNYRLEVAEDFALLNERVTRKRQIKDYVADIRTEEQEGRILAISEHASLEQKLYAIFAMENAIGEVSEYKEQDDNGKTYGYTRLCLKREVCISECEQAIHVICGASYEKKELENLWEKYTDTSNIEDERDRVLDKWKHMIARNYCELPDKNLQYFLNVWLKNQIYLTMRYNRFDIIGYRDVMQDTWGHLLVEPKAIRSIILQALSKMYPDGRCPRQYSQFSEELDARDFMDSPLWIPITVCDYVKETGDFSILQEDVGYYQSDKKDTVFEHMLLSLDYLYHSRGKNGLILMREGDWLDGLTGINKYGEATTVWGTIAAFHVQNILAELCREIKDYDTESMMLTRSAEYKKIVNEVAWDGNWYAYAFIDDEPIGASSCHEGKIYLNPQSWAIMSQIYDDENKVERMYRAISTYLATPYGPQLNAPAYKEYGEKCGRLQKQRPGTFANGGIYLHATTFMLMAHCIYQRYDDALDLMQRILPNHPDNWDTKRTSEPYSVGNVYYGSEHPCHGMNLYSWFSATPSWLIHCGFDGILGVKADYHGLRVSAHKISDWKEYSIKRRFRETDYTICFKEGTEKGIYVEGIKIEGNLIFSNNKECNVDVVF